MIKRWRVLTGSMKVRLWVGNGMKGIEFEDQIKRTEALWVGSTNRMKQNDLLGRAVWR